MWFRCILVLCMLAVVVQFVGVGVAEVAPDGSKTVVTVSEANAPVSFVNQYIPPPPITNKLLLRLADKPGALFAANGWTLNAINTVYSTDYIAWLIGNREPMRLAVLDARIFSLTEPAGKYSVSFLIDLGKGGKYQQDITRDWSWTTLRGCQRPNTAYGSSQLAVPGATFVANFEGECTKIWYALANLQGNISPYLPNSSEYGWDIYKEDAPGRLYASNAELLALTGRVNALLGAPPPKLQEAAEGEMGITILEREKDRVEIAWPDTGKWANCWLRLDSDAGELEVVAPDEGWPLPPRQLAQPIALTNCPPEGTTLHLYAISADGATWHHRAFPVPAYREGVGVE